MLLLQSSYAEADHEDARLEYRSTSQHLVEVAVHQSMSSAERIHHLNLVAHLYYCCSNRLGRYLCLEVRVGIELQACLLFGSPKEGVLAEAAH